MTRKDLRDESGIVMVVVMGTLLVLSLLAAAVLATSVFSATASTKQKDAKTAYGAAITGLRTAVYRLNTNLPAADTVCPILPSGLAAAINNGVCGPYSSDSSIGTQPMPTGQRYDYWITPAITSSDACAGNPLSSPAIRQLVFVTRCITARGQYTIGGRTYTKRVQARAVSTHSEFPIPGIWGTACVAINAGQVPSTGGCDTNVTAVSNSTYTGSLGSNATGASFNSAGQPTALSPAPVQVGVNDWQQNPLAVVGPGQVLNPANLYLGNTTPTSGVMNTTGCTLQSGSYVCSTANSGPYSIKDQNSTASPAGCPAGTLTGGAAFTTTYPCMPWSSNAPISFGFYFQLKPVVPNFAKAPDYTDSSKKPAAELGCGSNVSVDVCNNNGVLLTSGSTLISNIAQAVGTVSPVAHYWNASGANGCTGTPYNPVTRALSVGSGCTLTLPDGTYYFCSISLGSSSHVLPADQQSGAEVRVFLDNTTRSGSTCTGAGVGSFSTSGNQPNAPTWFTAAATNTCSATGSFTQDAWSALAGQLYIMGAGDPAPNPNFGNVLYPPKLNHIVGLTAGMLFNGLIKAPNSTLSLGNSTCVRGGLAAGAVNVANNGNFVWDSSVDKVGFTDSSSYFQTAFSDCSNTATDPKAC